MSLSMDHILSWINLYATDHAFTPFQSIFYIYQSLLSNILYRFHELLMESNDLITSHK